MSLVTGRSRPATCNASRSSRGERQRQSIRRSTHGSPERALIQDVASPATVPRRVLEGLGIGLLPPSIIGDELRQGRLKLVPADPAFEPVVYKAVYAAEHPPLGAIIAAEAKTVSTFRRCSSEPVAVPP